MWHAALSPLAAMEGMRNEPDHAVPAVHAEPHGGGKATWLNWLRAAALGSNDGIVSIVGLVVGVAGTTSSRAAILTAGLAGLFAGALAMASEEYVSVQPAGRRAAMFAPERRELAESPQAGATELARLYRSKGLPPDLSRYVAEQLTARALLAAHAEAELGIDPQQLARGGHLVVQHRDAVAVVDVLRQRACP